MKTPTKRVTRRLAASLAIATALGMAQTAWAATDIYYKGGPGSESSPINFLLKDYWTGNSSYSGGSIPQYPEGQYDMNFGFAEGANNTAYVYSSKSGTETKTCANYMKFHTGHFIFTSGNFKCGNTFYLGETANASATVTKKAGSWILDNNASVGHSGSGTLVQDGGSILVGNALYVGNSGAGTLTINGGTVEVDSASQTFPGWNSGSSGTINLNGGVFKTKRIACNQGRAYLNFNGGTLMANAAHASNQQFIKAENMTVTVGVGGGTIDNGGFDITIPAAINGSGSLTFRGTGTTTLSGGVNYSGVTRVVAGSTNFVSNTIATKMLSNGLELVGVPELNTPYTILASSSENDDWSSLSLSKVTCPVASEFTKAIGDDGKSIVVTVTSLKSGNVWTGAKDGNMSDPDNWLAGVVPADGADIDLSAATTVNAENRTFGAVTMGSGVVTFTGSLTATSFSDTSKVAVGANSTVTVLGNLEFSGSADEYICNTVVAGGRFVITGDIVVKAAKAGYLIPSLSSCAGVIAAKGLVKEKDGGINSGRMFKLAPDGGHVNWEIGEDGICGKNYFFVNSTAGSSAKIAATTNFTVSAAIANLKNLEFDAVGWTIALGNGSSGGIQGNGSTTVSGTGRIVANYDVDSLTSTADNKTQPFTVSGTATLALVPGARICTGVVTVNSGATLEVAESGTVSLGGNLALADGAALGFNYTTRNAPVLDLTGKTVTFDEGETTNVVVKISAAEGVRAKGGANVLTSGGKFTGVTVSFADDAPAWAQDVSVNEDGEIVLDVKPQGLMIIFK